MNKSVMRQKYSNDRSFSTSSLCSQNSKLALRETGRILQIGVETNSQAISALDLCKRQSSKPIITFCKALDDILGGGIPIGQLTEVCGPPGVGKTQLMMQLSLDIQIPEIFNGNDGDCIYIDTEGSFSPERLAEMADALSFHLEKVARINGKKENTTALSTSQLSNAAATTTRDRLLGRVHVFRAHDQAEFMAICHHLRNYIQTTSKKTKLIIIDSVAFHFRQDLQDAGNRNRLLTELSQLLQDLAFERDVAVVVTNHVTTRNSSALSSPSMRSSSLNKIIVPALGEQWSHCITNRLQLQWSDRDGVRTNSAALTKCPGRPLSSADFAICSAGIRDVVRKRNITSPHHIYLFI